MSRGTTKHGIDRPGAAPFNRGLGEVFTALTDAGMTTTAREEHPDAPWIALGNTMFKSPRVECAQITAKNFERLLCAYQVLFLCSNKFHGVK